MALIQFIYGLLFVMALFSALMVVLTPHAIYSALYLVLTMISIAGLFVMINAQLAAAFQVIVYAGAIMVLFLFVIMLLGVGREAKAPPKMEKVRIIGGVLSAALVAQLVAALVMLRAPRVPTPNGEIAGIQFGQVAKLLITDTVYAFEMTSVLLLIAVIGAVVLARRRLDPADLAPEAEKKNLKRRKTDLVPETDINCPKRRKTDVVPD